MTLVSGKLYEFEGKLFVFSRTDSAGRAIIHPPGEPSLRTSLTVDPSKIGVSRPLPWATLWDILGRT